MTRVFFYLEERSETNPTVVLNVNDQEIRLTATEFHGLMGEAAWISGRIHSARKAYYKSLAAKYKEVQDV